MGGDSGQPIAVFVRDSTTRHLVASSLRHAGHDTTLVCSELDLVRRVVRHGLPNALIIGAVTPTGRAHEVLRRLLRQPMLAAIPKLVLGGEPIADQVHVAAPSSRSKLVAGLMPGLIKARAKRSARAGMAELRAQYHEQLDGLEQLFRRAKRVVQAVADDSLPGPITPSGLAAVQNLVADERTGVLEVQRLLRTEQTLAAKMLCIANSARYSPATTIVDLPAAIRQLGLAPCLRFLQAMAMREYVPTAPALRRLGEESLTRAVLVALVAEQLASRSGGEGTAAYILGLFHNFAETLLVYALGMSSDVDVDRHGVSSVMARLGGRLTEAVCAHMALPPQLRSLHDYDTTSPEQRCVQHAIWLVDGFADPAMRDMAPVIGIEPDVLASIDAERESTLAIANAI